MHNGGSVDDSIEYRFVRGQGWVAGYKERTKYNNLTAVDIHNVIVRIGRTIVHMPRSIMYADGI